jgi:uncharacterized protein
MTITQQLTQDMKQAMRDRDSLLLGTLRFLLAEIKNVEIDQGELDDVGVQKIIARQIKQISETLADYQNAGRTDRVEEEKQKMAVLQKYLPQQLTDQELEEIVEKVLSANPDWRMGEVIREVLAQAAGQADGGRVSKIVQQKQS